ncbi:hypothetical protein [Roseibium alexandrii]|uniref:hypothetical protein n=1 Tax=Roseibium alexandrii TaxID=388408 RepID=UPI003751DD07
MNIYSKTVWIAATAYVVADDETDAEAQFDEIQNLSEVSLTSSGEIAIDGGSYRPDMPSPSLSPVATLHVDKEADEIVFVTELN